MGFVVVRMDDEEKRIHIDDISVLLFESTAVSLTTYLLAELVKRKTKVIFCDNEHNPSSELVPCYGNYNSSGRIRVQTGWGSDIKAKVWREIVREKIRKQAAVLAANDSPDGAEALLSYAREVENGDITNREGHAAKVYFNRLFDEDFFRNSSDVRNAILNYGYTILLSAFNREIAANGYLTQIGIWHDNAGNPFNFASDLMEPFRPVVDNFAKRCGFSQFEKDEKMAVLDLLNKKVEIDDSKQYLSNAIGIYARSIFEALNDKDESKILFYSYEL
jgi:CRISPR-associated endonuclease Cas1 subtype II